VSLRLKIVSAIFLLITIAGLAGGFYLWFLPHRDVAATPVDFTLTADALVTEYLHDAVTANAKYLARDGNSRVLLLTGTIHAVRTNQAGATVVILREPAARAGVVCTFRTPPATEALRVGSIITLKGVIRAGAQYSDVLDTYIDAVVDECTFP
jgi:hypothetical protein